MTTAEFVLGPCNEVPVNGSKQYRIERDGTALDLFVVHDTAHYYAYENRCPHVGVNLNWQPDVFLNYDQTHIQCSTHGAQFRIHDGLCEWGPCVGESLRPLAVKPVDGQLVLSLDLTGHARPPSEGPGNRSDTS